MSLLPHANRSKTFTSRRLLLTSLLGDSSKRFCTAAEQSPVEPSAADDSSVDQFLRDTAGSVYGRLPGITRHTLKTDITNLLEGSNLRNDDIKVDTIPFANAYHAALRAIARKGKLHRLEKAGRSQWDILMPYDGKTLLLHGLPRNVHAEDIERFLAGCKYDSSSIQILTRPGFPEPVKVALVHFPSRIAATNAFVTKNRGFCLNNQVTVRVLE